MLVGVRAFAPGVFDGVAGEFEGGEDALVGDPPIAAVDVEVLVSVLEEDAEGFGFGFADEGSEFIAATEADVGADHGVDAAEGIGALPCDVEGGDGTG